MRIIIQEVNDSSQVLEFDWLPPEIKVSGGDIMFSTYTMLDRGEIARTNGNEVEKIAWESMFPGEQRADSSVLSGEWVEPSEYDNLIKRWRKKKKLLKLTIEDTNISNYKCYVESYESSYSGGFGDLHYRLSLVQYRSISIGAVKKQAPTKKNPKRPVVSKSTYVVVKGDMLSTIAAKKLGSAKRWKEIYNLNKGAVEKAAIKNGKRSSGNGHWIYPGTKLRLPIGKSVKSLTNPTKIQK